jgi:nucleoside-diphosphate-sugar epimerase
MPAMSTAAPRASSTPTAAFGTALVTGASGFIGGRLVRRLAEVGGRVSCLVRSSSAVEDLRAARAEILTADVTDRDAVQRAVSASQPAVVFHLAGLVRASRRCDFMRVNAGGVEAVAAACTRCERRPTLVVVSSLAAAGPSDASPRSEDDAPAPVSAYGRSKLAGERIAASYANDLPVTIVRPPIVFGPGDHGVLEVMRPIARWGAHPVPGRGEFRLSMVHVDDLVDAVLGVVQRGERIRGDGESGCGVYFVASDEHPTYAELGQRMASALGRDTVRLLCVPPILLRVAGFGGDVLAHLRRRKSWVNSDKVREALAGHWICSSAKARDHMGWQPLASLMDRLRETVQWYRSSGWL